MFCECTSIHSNVLSADGEFEQTCGALSVKETQYLRCRWGSVRIRGAGLGQVVDRHGLPFVPSKQGDKCTVKLH